jgi:hypothetical protein
MEWNNRMRGREMNAEETEKKRRMKTHPRNVTDISNRRMRKKTRRGGIMRTC